MEPMQGEPVRTVTSSRLDRVDAARAASWIIIAGLVLLGCAVLTAGLNAFHDGLFGFAGGGNPKPTFLDRFQVFIGNLAQNAPWAVLVVAAGFALRVLSTRPQTAVVPPPPLPEPELPTSPVQLPDKVATQVVLVEPSADDEIWRR
ncbi:MAG: hypothetical protein RJA49_953 [Actinomycetota bacterium]